MQTVLLLHGATLAVLEARALVEQVGDHVQPCDREAPPWRAFSGVFPVLPPGTAVGVLVPPARSGAYETGTSTAMRAASNCAEPP